MKTDEERAKAQEKLQAYLKWSRTVPWAQDPDFSWEKHIAKFEGVWAAMRLTGKRK